MLCRLPTMPTGLFVCIRQFSDTHCALQVTHAACRSVRYQQSAFWQPLYFAGHIVVSSPTTTVLCKSRTKPVGLFMPSHVLSVGSSLCLADHLQCQLVCSCLESCHISRQFSDTHCVLQITYNASRSVCA